MLLKQQYKQYIFYIVYNTTIYYSVFEKIWAVSILQMVSWTLRLLDSQCCFGVKWYLMLKDSVGHTDISIHMCLRKKMHFTLISTCLPSACLHFYLSSLTFSIKSGKNPELTGENLLLISCPNTKPQKTFTSFKFMHWRCSRAVLSIQKLLNKWDFRSNNKHFVFACHCTVRNWP